MNVSALDDKYSISSSRRSDMDHCDPITQFKLQTTPCLPLG